MSALRAWANSTSTPRRDLIREIDAHPARQNYPYTVQIAALISRSRAFRPGTRFLVYGLAGLVTDSLFVFIRSGRRPSSLLNVPVYGLAQPLFEPVHERVRQRPLAFRAALYGVGILGVEYTSGRLLRRFVGNVPWDYGRARFSIDGLVRLDYFPLWAAYGLGLEYLHDFFVSDDIGSGPSKS